MNNIKVACSVYQAVKTASHAPGLVGVKGARTVCSVAYVKCFIRLISGFICFWIQFDEI